MSNWWDRFDSAPPAVREWQQESWDERVAAFLKSPEDESRFDWPFPMGVFGTLRSHQGNNVLMQRAEITRVRPAFLPHFYAHGLSIGHGQNNCAPFEVFEYTPAEWVKMIPRVDMLEGFRPHVPEAGASHGGYYRTLAWLRLMPEGHVDGWFPAGQRADIWGRRDMAIPQDQWPTYERIPCWVYSSINQNRQVSQMVDSPVVWPLV